MRIIRLTAFVLLLMLGVRGQMNETDVVERLVQRVTEMDTWRAGQWQLYTENGQWKYRKTVNWLSGFLGGELWQLYRLTGQPDLKNRALRFARSLMPYVTKDDTHDMGFIFYPTLVFAYQETGLEAFKNAGLTAARMLMKRYNPKGHFIRAWGKLGTSNKAGWSIIDTMMNLELLFWAAQVSGDYHFAEVAYYHAITSMKAHVRPDGSTFHVVVFDPANGRVLKKQTHQGATDSSTWARGQAWAVYGFATAFQYTKDQRFLQTAKNLADFMLSHLTQDGVPYWDLTAPQARNFKDASAAAILAAGLYRLAKLVSSGDDFLRYQRWADKLVQTLANHYTYWHSKRPNEQGLLLHQVYHFHKKWAVDETYPAGDYYFTEAFVQYWQRHHLFNSHSARQNIRFNQNWLYLEENFTSPSQALHNSQWQRVNLPHTWNRTDVMDGEPGYRRQGSWYRKRFFLPQIPQNQRLLIRFEAANTRCKVWLNGTFIGQHIGGYLGFELDLTPALKTGENELLVFVSNEFDRNLIPSQKSDFFIYGGLTRDVWLLRVPQTYLKQVFISTPLVSAQSAQVDVKVRVVSPESKKLKLIVDVFDPNGQKVLTVSQPVKLQKGLNGLNLPLLELSSPLLWSPQTPQLYTLRVVLQENGESVDQLTESFGLRWFEFKKHGPFYLNGKRLLLRGTHRHEEHAGYGAAMPNYLHRQDMEAIKQMGANFVRLAHYPQDPEVYRACDSLGLLVWDELPWCRGGMGGKTWQQNTLRLLREQIEQNFNHPSIIIWSLGNELNWLPDFPAGNNADSLRFMLKRLNELAHRLDPGRLTAVRKYQGAVNIVDLFSPSIWAGWYSGVYKNYQKALEVSRQKYDRFFHAEFGGASHVGRHSEQVITGEGLVEAGGWEENEIQTLVQNIARTSDWSENYIVDLFDWYLHVMSKLDWLSGAAQWAFKDFGTPLRPENPIPYVNQKGLVDRQGRPKDAYFVFKSYWNTQEPFCYIESHTWTERYGPSGKSRLVCVYSNCSQVELWHNGQNLGRKQRDESRFPAANLHWQVPFVEGKNVLIARGFTSENEMASDTLVIHYRYSRPRPATHLQLSVKKIGMARYRLVVRALDKEGQLSLDYNKRVYFSALQGARLQKNLGTPDGSAVIEMANGRASILFDRYPDQKMVIEVRNQDFKGSYLILEPWQHVPLP